jgi:hypothetical protein
LAVGKPLVRKILRRTLLGRLAMAMNELCEEIRSSRRNRQEFIKGLADGGRKRRLEVFAFLADFVITQTLRAVWALERRRRFVDALKQAVAEHLRHVRESLLLIRCVWVRKDA